jgi:hypothetical protein
VAFDSDEELTRALRLGYLKVDRRDDDLVDAYLASCLEQGRPSVLLQAERSRSWSISFRFPPFQRRITEEGVLDLRRRIRPARSGSSRRCLICGNGGELTGLSPHEAEVIAFRIADAANDRERTRDHAP